MADFPLPEKVAQLASFRRELRRLTIRSVAEQFYPPLAMTLEASCSEVALDYLLECATVLAHSDRGDSQDAALRIAHYALSRDTASDGQKAAAAIALDMLTNRPALSLAIRRRLLAEDFLDAVPRPLMLDALRREVEYSVADAATGEITPLNRFQTTVYRTIGEARWVSVSAPTSSGKSFILERIVRDAIAANEARHIVYIVPTRALVHEVELDFRATLSKLAPAPLITSVPHLPPHSPRQPLVLVFTQERLHLLLTDSPSFAPDLIVVDEAQKIGDGARGVLLEQVLDEVNRRAPDVRMVFASPMSANPEALLEYASEEVRTTAVLSEQVAVNQNLLWASQVKGKPTEWTLDLCLPDELVRLGTFTLLHKPSHDTKRLPFVAAVLGGGGGNIVYVRGAADAEATALLLADYFRDSQSDDDELAALAELARRTIHTQYALVETLPAQVAFHYGNMPLVIRSEIERLFRAGKLHYLVCTSTLIEGVNLPARSIFVRGPQKGHGKPMNDVDFWNLAGRAGRQGKEFQGNIVCVDPWNESVWKEPPPRERQRYSIERTTAQVLRNRGEEILDYIESGTPRSQARRYDELESAFVYLLEQHLRWGTLGASPKVASVDSGLIARLERACSKAYSSVEVPQGLLARNPGVSPLAQQRLLVYFRQKIPIEDAIPVDPFSEDAVSSYRAVIGRTSEYLSGDPLALNHPRAILVVNWMRGYSLARLIDAAWRYWKPKGKKLATVIRDTMSEVEEYARFRFAKYSSCYVDVLRFRLGEMDRADLAAQIPRLSIWLEFGTSVVTQLSLMGLGLSRTAAIEVSRFIADDSLEREAALERLRELNLEAAGLSPIITEEVQRILGAERKSA